MDDSIKCTGCGTELPPGAPGGHCPRCLLGFAGLPAQAEEPAANADRSFRPEQAGDTIRHYKLLKKIGEGGHGVVYMAEQQAPSFRRQVALKVLKPGMDSKEILARFEAERQLLAMMEHPNIAQIFDAGMTDSGRPFFVMELVRGTQITDYCDQNKLPTKERLELFIQTCRAVHHAHQKGVIHRDIKPSNILVTRKDGQTVLKVIDFGIAKAVTGQALADKRLFTASEKFIGTPAYMSPEQAGMSGVGIDPRSDIYSLGVLLYELLTGRPPFDPVELTQGGLDGARRIIREKEPKRPSTCLGTLAADQRATVANRRQTEPAKLIHCLRGQLDWIVMKCLQKDPSRRYNTVDELALDIQHYLDQVPIAARPPGLLNRFQNLVRRHKTAFAIACVAALLIAIVALLAAMLKKSPPASMVSGAPALSHEDLNALAASNTVPGTAQPAAEPIPVVAASTAADGDASAGSGADTDIDDTNAAPFMEELTPYGRWMNLNGKMYWQPNAVALSRDWRPYSDNGRWVYTDDGWAWDSDYEWGWAAFHYGRWLNDTVLGWIWQPGSVWAPAWVAWRGDETHCGWAPLPPGTTFDAGLGLMANDAPVGPDFDFGLGPDDYCFIDITNFCNESYTTVLVSTERVLEVYRKCKHFRHAYGQHGRRMVNAGIEVDRVRRVTHEEIRPMKIFAVASSRLTGLASALDADNTLAIYRPKRHEPVRAGKLLDDILDGRSPSSAKPTHDQAGDSVAKILGRGRDTPGLAGERPSRPESPPLARPPAYPNTVPPADRSAQAALDRARAAQAAIDRLRAAQAAIDRPTAEQEANDEAERQERQDAARAESARLQQMRQARQRALQARARAVPRGRPR